MSETAELPSIDHSTQIAHPEAPLSRPSPLAVIFDSPQSANPDHYGLLSGYQWDFLRGKMLRAGVSLDSVTFYSLLDLSGVPADVLIVGLGEKTLNLFTEKKSVDKWCLSPLQDKQGRKFIPSYDPIRVQKQFELGLYQELAFRRAVEESASLRYSLPPERFLLNPTLEETLATLEKLEGAEALAIDVETGYGQINTVGFAWSASDAIAINVLPDRCGADAYFKLWSAIARVLQGPSRKIFQNFIYDVSYFSAYGIHIPRIDHDTMWAMKVLYPEFKSNLGNVGRFYTKWPYWKDDGKETDEESGKRDWGNIRDWTKHYLYNCRDTTGTFEAAGAQRKDLTQAGFGPFFFDYLMRLAEPIREMCATGMPLSLDVRERLIRETEGRLTGLLADFHAKCGSEVNPNSPKQVLSYLTSHGVKIPKKYDRATKEYKESADAASIKKIRLKNPDLPGLAELQDIKGLGKALSSYLRFEAHRDGRLSYSLNGAGTETLRWSGGKDPWDRGFNIQTIPREGGDVSIKSMFVSPPGCRFIEVDLRQAESRFVAYDSADKTLIDMLESGADVHTHVGKAILRQMGRDPDSIPKEEFKGTWRQLGKKAGHGLNYAMKPLVFVETVFNELDLVISKRDAEQITAAYYGLFPGIPRWHAWIRNELYTKRQLSLPSGWRRTFYGRPGDDMNKEAYAFRPQHTIPWITNHMMMFLCERRRERHYDFSLIYQGHDALFLYAPEEHVDRIARDCDDISLWHPLVDLPGGRLLIPTEIKTGTCMANLEEWHRE